MKTAGKLSLVALLALALPAAAVTYDAQLLDEPTDVANTGRLVFADNLGDDTDATINGILFSHTPTATITAIGGGVQTYGSIDLFYDLSSDPGLREAVNSIVYQNSNGAGNGLRITIPGLIAGKTYRVQILTGDKRTSGIPGNHELQLTIQNTTSPLYKIGTFPGADFIAANITATFTATTDHELIDIVQVNAGAGSPFFGALAVHDPFAPSVTYHAQLLDEPTDVANDGTLVFADNFADDTDATINGILFSKATTATITALYGDSANYNDSGTLFYDLSSDPGLLLALNSVAYQREKGAGKGLQVTVLGLTAGRTYRVQMLAGDKRTAGLTDNHELQLAIQNTKSPLYKIGGFAGADFIAANITATFVAEGTRELIDIRQVNGDAETVFLGALAVHEIGGAPALRVGATAMNPLTGAFELMVEGFDLGHEYALRRSETLLDNFPTTVVSPYVPGDTTDMIADPAPPPQRAFYIVEDLGPVAP